MDSEPSRLIGFYLGSGTDDRGRSFEEILAFADVELEDTHDYIQWLFPLSTPSAFNLSAPMLTGSEIAAFRSDDRLQRNMVRALERMLAFYGFGLIATGRPKVVKSEAWKQRSAQWLDPYNHNYLRITRILRSLTTVGLSEYAIAFYEALRDAYENAPEGLIPARTFRFWSEAVERSS